MPNVPFESFSYQFVHREITRGLPAMFLAWNSPGLQCSINCVPLKYHKCIELVWDLHGSLFCGGKC